MEDDMYGDDEIELTDSQENAVYDEDMGFLDETSTHKERVIRGRLQPYECKNLTVGEVMASQRKLIQRANEVLSGVPPGQMRILLRKARWNVESLLETFAEKGEKAIFDAAGLIPPADAKKTPTAGKGSCLTCMEEYPYSQMAGLSCGHIFCKSCWKNYLNLKITEEGQKANLVPCMAFKCSVIVDESLVAAIVDKDVYQKYLRFLLQSYVDDHPYMTWCAGAGCQLALEITHGERCIAVKCSCGADFCFACKEPPHLPATCPMGLAWKKKLMDDSETYNWLRSNTKDCPQCNKATEKNGGCNHISCTCGAHWCWMCNKNFNTQTVYSHSCNAFDDKNAFSSDHVQTARAALDRYLHYFTRYDNHHKSKKLESTLSDKMKSKMEKLTALDKNNPCYIDQVYLKESLEALFQCRDILKNTYVYAFYMFESEQQQKLLGDIPPFRDAAETKAAKSQFEFHQEGLEMTTEQLSGMLELPVERIIDEKNFRVKTIDLTKNALNKFDAMFKVVAWIKKNATGSWEQALKAKEDAERRAKDEAERKSGDKSKKVKKGAEPIQLHKPPARGFFGFGGAAVPAVAKMAAAPVVPRPPAAAVVPAPAAVPARARAPRPAPAQAASVPARAPAAAAAAPVVADDPDLPSDEDPELQQALLASMLK